MKKQNEVDYKQNSAKHWGNDPCDTRYGENDKELLSKDYFEKITKARYTDQGWLLDEISTFDIKGKEVLEIGYGMGTDHLEMAKMGGIMHGISITPNDKKIVDKRFELYGKETETIVGDVEDMPYDDNTFDFVYSFGVLHHTPNINKALTEIYRVMKPNGKCYLAVYNKNSMFFWWTLFLWTWLISRDFLKHTLKQRVSLLEYPNDDPNLYVKLYTKKEFSKKIKKAGFEIENVHIDHLDRKSIAVDRWFSDKFIESKRHKLGWYIIVEAKKQ